VSRQHSYSVDIVVVWWQAVCIYNSMSDLTSSRCEDVNFWSMFQDFILYWWFFVKLDCIPSSKPLFLKIYKSYLKRFLYSSFDLKLVPRYYFKLYSFVKT